MKSTLRTDFSEVKFVFGFCVRLGNPHLDFENPNPDFPMERTLRLSFNLFHFIVFLLFSFQLKSSFNHKPLMGHSSLFSGYVPLLTLFFYCFPNQLQTIPLWSSKSCKIAHFYFFKYFRNCRRGKIKQAMTLL